MGDDYGMPDVNSAGDIQFDELAFISLLGSGAFGAIYKGEYLGSTVAIKQIEKSTSRYRRGRSSSFVS